MVKIALIDNRDSFSYTIVDYLLQLGTDIRLIHLDEITSHKSWIDQADGIVLGPGPGHPAELPMLQLLLKEYILAKPILGICLGFQAICLHFGAEIKKGQPIHGKISEVKKIGASHLFQGLPETFQVVRYHSLCVENVQKPLRLTLLTKEGVSMGIEHENWPIMGVQFHPEAHLSEHGLQILNNWLNFW